MKYKSFLSFSLLLFINFSIHFSSFSQYTCQTIDFSMSKLGPFVCTDAKVKLLANDPPSTTIANKWIYPGFIVKVWALPGYSFTNQIIEFLDEGSVGMSEPYSGGDTLVLAIDHVQSGNYSFRLKNIGTNQFGYKIINAADGSIAGTGTYLSSYTTTNVFLPIGTWSYTITRVGAGATATGVSNDPNSGGDGFFDPATAGEGTFDITYSWNNGAGCSGTSNAKRVVVTCPPPSACNSTVGTFNISGATLNGTAYDIAKGATINITNNSDAVMPTGTHRLSYAFFKCDPRPLSSSQLLNLNTVTCYLGSDNHTFTSDDNISGFSSTFNTLNRVYVLPYTSAAVDVIDDGSGCYAIGNIIELNYLSAPKICPSNPSFSKLNWSAGNPFGVFSPTTFNCNDGLQKIWKMPETSIGNKGEIQGFPGFHLYLEGLSTTKSSILVSVNGTPYSYYGNTAPANVLDWGSMSPLGLGGTFDIIEPFIPAGANVSIEICDSRNTTQSIPYSVYDHASGLKIISGTSTPSNGNCKSITFTISTPIITWNIDGDVSKITNNNDGSASFDPSSLSAGAHVINYSFNKNSCILNASQNITINPLTKPTFSLTPSQCENSVAQILQSTSNNSITGTWNPASVNTSALGKTTYTFTPTTGQCATTETMEITIKPNVTPTFTLIDNFCVNSLAQPLPTTSDNSILGTWSPSSIVTSNPGSTTYQFAPDANQCASGISKTITVYEKPIAKATPSTLAGKSVLDVNFTN